MIINMLYLKNVHTNDFLHLTNDGGFSFQATNQLQDLEKYDVGYSFDVELVNDANARDVVLGEWYADGSQTMNWNGGIIDIDLLKLPQVILYSDNIPMFIGKMSVIGTDISTIKAVFKCVPYGRTFKNFDMRSTLKDYFKGGAYEGLQVRHVLEQNIFSITGADKNPNKIFTPSVIVYNPNRQKRASSYRFDTDCYVNNKDDKAVKFSHFLHNQYWWLSSVSQILECMNITLPEDEAREIDKLEFDYILENKAAMLNSRSVIAHPIKLHYNRELKVRYYKGEYNNANHVVYYNAFGGSEIWWRNDQFHEYELLNSGSFEGVPFEAFATSIKQNKGLDGLVLKDVQFPPNYDRVGIITLNSDVAFKSVDFAIESGHKYQDGEDCRLALRISDTAKYDKYEEFAEYVDVIFDFELNMAFEKVQAYNDTEDTTIKDLYKSVPLMGYDIALLETPTTEFLNGLSLNNNKYTWLRNPSYITSNNKELIHNIDSDIELIPKLDTNVIESISKSVKYDTSNDIEISTPVGLNTIVRKKLNYKDTTADTKRVEQHFTSLAWTGLSNVFDGSKEKPYDRRDPSTIPDKLAGEIQDIPLRGTPPLVLNKEDDTYLNNDIIGAFGQCQVFKVKTEEVISYHDYDYGWDQVSYYYDQIWWHATTNTDYDYLNDYCDKSEQYNFTVIGGLENGYFMQEKFEFEGQLFYVESYKTSDFLKYDIVAYPYTPWVKREAWVEPKYDSESHKLVYTKTEYSMNGETWTYSPRERTNYSPNGRQVRPTK